jgi:methionine-rich copper-binding protein CopC
MRIRTAGAIAIIAMALLCTPQMAFAHTSLVSSDPTAGSTLTSWPSQISLGFDEELISIGDEKSNFIVVNNAVGDQVSSDNEVISGSKISVSLDPNIVEGPVLIYYRVVSADGHPVAASAHHQQLVLLSQLRVQHLRWQQVDVNRIEVNERQVQVGRQRMC